MRRLTTLALLAFSAVFATTGQTYDTTGATRVNVVNSGSTTTQLTTGSAVIGSIANTVFQAQGAYNSSAPTFTSGQASLLQTDAAGNLYIATRTGVTLQTTQLNNPPFIFDGSGNLETSVPAGLNVNNFPTAFGITGVSLSGGAIPVIINGAMANPGTSATQAVAVQGVTSGVAIPVVTTNTPAPSVPVANAASTTLAVSGSTNPTTTTGPGATTVASTSYALGYNATSGWQPNLTDTAGDLLFGLASTSAGASLTSPFYNYIVGASGVTIGSQASGGDAQSNAQNRLQVDERGNLWNGNAWDRQRGTANIGGGTNTEGATLVQPGGFYQAIVNSTSVIGTTGGTSAYTVGSTCNSIAVVPNAQERIFVSQIANVAGTAQTGNILLFDEGASPTCAAADTRVAATALGTNQSGILLANASFKNGIAIEVTGAAMTGEVIISY